VLATLLLALIGPGCDLLSAARRLWLHATSRRQRARPLTELATFLLRKTCPSRFRGEPLLVPLPLGGPLRANADIDTQTDLDEVHALGPDSFACRVAYARLAGLAARGYLDTATRNQELELDTLDSAPRVRYWVFLEEPVDRLVVLCLDSRRAYEEHVRLIRQTWTRAVHYKVGSKAEVLAFAEGARIAFSFSDTR
jgi:hypothetical protein